MTAAVCLIVACLMTGSAFFAIAFFESRIKQSIFEAQYTFVSRLADEFDEKINDLQNDLVGMAKTFPPEAVQNPQKAQRYLDSRLDAAFLFDNAVAVLSSSGHLIAEHPDVFGRRGQDYSSHDYFQKTAATGKPYVSSPHSASEMENYPVITFTAPVFGRDGEVAAVLCGSVSLLDNSYFAKLRGIKVGRTGYTYVYAKDRTMIIHPDVSIIGQKDVPVGANRLFDAALAGFEGTEETVTSKGLYVLASFKHMKKVDWIVASNYPIETAYAPLHQARNIFYFLIVGVVVITMTVVWLLMKRLTQPLVAFAEHVKHLPGKMNGEMLFRSRTGDEIETLSDAFNTMITGMVEKTDALRQSEARYAKAEAMTHMGHWQLELPSGTMSWSDEMYRIFGLELRGFDGTLDAFAHFIHPEDRAVFRNALDEALEKKTGYDIEHRICRPDTGVVFIRNEAEAVLDEKGDPVRIMGSVRDITRRKKTEEALKRSRDFYLTLFEGFPALIWQSGTDSLFNFFNRTWLEFTGRTFEQEAGYGWTEQIHPDDREAFLSSYRHVFHARMPFEAEFRLRRSDGMYRWMVAVGRAFNDIDGTFSGFIGSCYDITWKKEIEERLLRLQEEEKGLIEAKNRQLQSAYADLKALQSQLLQQEKMSSIGQLAAGVAHEINNPVGFIISNLGTLRKYSHRMSSFIQVQADVLEKVFARVPEAASIREELNSSSRAAKIDYIRDDMENLISESLDGAERVKRIVQDLKGFSRIDEAESTMADINAGLDSTINIVWNEIKYKVAVHRDFGAIPLTKCNPGQLNQVFMNMLINAAQAIPERGEIRIRTRAGQGSIFIAISDTGTGIPPEKIGRIFDPFFTTKDVGKGTGLGLSIAYDIVKKHDGEITVQSEEGKGTMFTVTIPVVEG